MAETLVRHSNIRIYRRENTFSEGSSSAEVQFATFTAEIRGFSTTQKTTWDTEAAQWNRNSKDLRLLLPSWFVLSHRNPTLPNAQALRARWRRRNYSVFLFPLPITECSSIKILGQNPFFSPFSLHLKFIIFTKEPIYIFITQGLQHTAYELCLLHLECFQTNFFSEYLSLCSTSQAQFTVVISFSCSCESFAFFIL